MEVAKKERDRELVIESGEESECGRGRDWHRLAGTDSNE